MSHPCLVTLDQHSAPRVLFSGDRLVDVQLPAGARVLYPKPPIAPVADVQAAVRRAIEAPLGSAPLSSKLRPGMKVTLSLADTSMPQTRTPDARQTVLELVLEELAAHGVEDVELVVATGLNRRLKAKELRQLVGDRVFSAHFPKRLKNHDAVKSEELSLIGETEYDEVVELNRRAAESDLLIVINVCTLPNHGGYESLCVGLGSHRSIRTHYNPNVLRRCFSALDPASSGLATSVERTGRKLTEALDVFAIEVVLNNRTFPSALEFLSRNEDDLPERDRLLAKAMVESSARLPQVARRALFQKVGSGYGVIGVYAGDLGEAHKAALERVNEQCFVPVEGQADVLIAGIHHTSPFNVGSFLNPLLVQFMAEGLAFNMYRGAPLVRKGGTLIITHPCTDRFDPEQHGPYIDFVHQLLSETRDGVELERRYEAKFAQNPAFLEMYERGHSYHPAHPFLVWYWGEAARQHLGRVIVVGADNEYVPRILGYETAPNMDEALYRARGGELRNLDVLCLHAPPYGLADVTVPTQP
jgi:hypothetical protein